MGISKFLSIEKVKNMRGKIEKYNIIEDPLLRPLAAKIKAALEHGTLIKSISVSIRQ